MERAVLGFRVGAGNDVVVETSTRLPHAGGQKDAWMGLIL